MDTLTAIRKQRAVRDFTAQDVTDEQLTQVLDAGRRSGSSKNTQPWQFIVVRDPQTRAALAGCGRFAQHLIPAPVVIVVVMPAEGFWAGVDAGRAAQNMMLAATSGPIDAKRLSWVQDLFPPIRNFWNFSDASTRTAARPTVPCASGPNT